MLMNFMHLDYHNTMKGSVESIIGKQVEKLDVMIFFRGEITPLSSSYNISGLSGLYQYL